MALYWQHLGITPCRTYALICKYTGTVEFVNSQEKEPHLQAMRKWQLHKSLFLVRRLLSILQTSSTTSTGWLSENTHIHFCSEFSSVCIKQKAEGLFHYWIIAQKTLGKPHRDKNSSSVSVLAVIALQPHITQQLCAQLVFLFVSACNIL